MTLQKDGTYSVKVDNLPAKVYDRTKFDYVNYTYDAEELPIEGYTSAKERYVSGVKFINTVSQQYIPMSVEKTWVDTKSLISNADHPDVTFRLYAETKDADGKVLAAKSEVAKVVLPSGSTSVSFKSADGKGFPVYDASHDYAEITYTVEEDPVPGYVGNNDEPAVEELSDGGYKYSFKNTSIKGELRKYNTNDKEASAPTPIKGAKFVITKTDDEWKPLTGDAEWKVNLESGWNLEYAVKARKSGGITPGHYIMEELEAPQGYTVNTQKAHFVVNEDGTVVQDKELDTWANSYGANDGNIVFTDAPLMITTGLWRARCSRFIPRRRRILRSAR